MDDMLHVLQAVYCDVYVTADEKQSAYASLLLGPQTRVAIYDGQTPIDLWILGFCKRFAWTQRNRLPSYSPAVLTLF